MEEQGRQVRFHIFRFYLENCHPPTVEELATLTGLSSNNVEDVLKFLEEEHHLVLHKPAVGSPTPIAMVHPFSHLPTPYVVSQGQKSWWANCAWCSFGLASMLSPVDGTIRIRTRSGSIGQELLFEVINGEVLASSKATDCVVHFSLPPSRWWEDVRFTCSSIQVFGSKTEPDEWCSHRGFRKGAVISLQTMWELGKAWYSDKADYEYRRKSPAEAEELFNSLGMTGEFWSVTGKENFR